MLRGIVATLGALALVTSGCTTRVPAARFVFVSMADVVPVEVAVRNSYRMMCRSLPFNPNYPDHSIAVAKAIADVKNANIMTNVLVFSKEKCVYIEGNVGRVVAAASDDFGAPTPTLPANAVGLGLLPRGSFARLSTVDVPVSFTVVNRNAEGESCGSPWQPRFELATRDALAKSPPADALMYVEYFAHKDCIRVEGMAVEVE